MRYLLFFLFVLFAFAKSIDKVTLAEKYLDGIIGAKIEKKIVENEEYHEHLEEHESVKGIPKTEKVTIVIPNYKKGIEILENEIKKGNVRASLVLYRFLIRWVNFKSKSPEKVMIENMKKKLKISYKTYLKLIKESLKSIKKYCRGRKNEEINSYLNFMCIKLNRG